MKKFFNLFCVEIILLFGGCTQRPTNPLEDIYVLAGKNRHELERVIAHYSKDPADSLKLKAAEFLILNIPGKYTESYDAPWENVATVNLRWSSSSDKLKVLEAYKIGNPIRKDDINYITADYLISNIDLAFQAWNDKPWGKYISFETFCEDILPYRIGTEPLENWREKVLASFADLNNSLKEDSTLTSVGACSKVNDLLPRFRLDKDFSNMSFTQLMATTRGMCDSQATLAAFVMRGLGIPVTIDFTPQWKSLPTGHTWNSVCDSAGQHISFMGTESNPYAPHQGNTLYKAKAYRKTYKNQRIIETDGVHTPPLFRDNIVDISGEHDKMINVAISIERSPETTTGYVFLALFYDFEWRLTGHGTINSDSIRFQHIGKEILCLPVYYENDMQTPAGDPFYVDSNGKIHVLASDTSSVQTLFSSITSGDDFALSHRMVDGVFESSDNPIFSDVKTIHKILVVPKLYNKVILKKPHTCQYVRYKSPAGFCNVSEITFLDASGEEIKGKYIGLPGSHMNLGDTGDKAFDGNIFTFYDAVDNNNSWTALDFGEQKTIASICYSPRISGIGIYEGHEYELFCWKDDGWGTAGVKIATGTSIEFNIPRNALLYLKNNTLGKRGQVFLIVDGNMFYYN